MDRTGPSKEVTVRCYYRIQYVQNALPNKIWPSPQLSRVIHKASTLQANILSKRTINDKLSNRNEKAREGITQEQLRTSLEVWCSLVGGTFCSQKHKLTLSKRRRTPPPTEITEIQHNYYKPLFLSAACILRSFDFNPVDTAQKYDPENAPVTRSLFGKGMSTNPPTYC